MNDTFFESIEKRKIAQLARKYRAKGYEVLAELPGYEPPYQIRGFRPDLIVKKGDETIVMEVKTSDSIKKTKDALAEFARYVKGVPGARFDLVMTNPKPALSVYSKIQTLQAELGTLREGLLTEIKEASEKNRTDLVLILSVRLLEGLLARLAMSESIHIPTKEWNLASLATKLAKEDIISKSVLEFANRLYQRRNAVIHQRDKKVISNEEAVDIYIKLKKLTRQWGGTIKMTEVICPVCQEAFNSYLNLARHMVLKDRPNGEHIQYLERFLGKTFAEFGWRSDARIATALKHYLLKHREWPR